MNRGQIKSAIQTEMQLDPGLVSDAERNRFLDYWLDDVGSWGVLERTSTVTYSARAQEATLPETVIHLNQVILGNRELKLAYGAELGVGEPRFYSVSGNSLRLYPTPTENVRLTITYSYRPEYLTSDSDVPEIPRDWIYLGVLYGVYRSHKKNGNVLMSREYNQEYEQKKAEKMREYLAKYNSTVRTIKETSEVGENPLTRFI